MILAVAAGLLFVAPRLTPQQVPGSASADWPVPPRVGACVNLPERGAVDVVPCSDPHDAEVTRSWAATDPALDASPASWIDGACADAADEFVGAGAPSEPVRAGPGTSWLQPPGLRYSAFDIGAPDSERVGELGWRICVVRPTMPVRYGGTVRDASPANLDMSMVPEAYRTCLDAIGNVASCTMPHTAEVIATGTAVTDIEVDRYAPDPGVVFGWEGSDPPDGTPLQQMAQQRAEQLFQIATQRAAAENTHAMVDSSRKLATLCADTAAGLIPGLAAAKRGARPTVGLSGSSAALATATEQSTSVGVMSVDSDTQNPAILGIGERDGYETVTGACVVTAPDGMQLTRSLIGWDGDTLPLISG